VESKFTKSLTNSGTQNVGLALLTTDPRFRAVDLLTKRRILDLIGTSTSYGIQTFDAIMTPPETPALTADNIDRYVDGIRMVEMKSTRKPIKNAGLSGFFFGATEREYAMAQALGDRYLFAFIVLNDNNEYGHPFAVLLTLAEVKLRTRSQRIQYQVNFRSDIDSAASADSMIVFGGEEHIPHE
jgi:hypothetical protein